MKFIYCSSNSNKFNEIKKTFPYPLDFVSCELTEIQGTLEDIASSKAIEAYQILKNATSSDFMAIIDDVSLEISSLNGFPGPYIKHFMKIDLEKICLMLENIEKEAKVYCGLGLAYFSVKTNKIIQDVVVGECEGHLVFDRIIKSKRGFGFDSIFMPCSANKTYGEMELEEKNRLSHRTDAVEKLVEYIKKNIDIFDS